MTPQFGRACFFGLDHSPEGGIKSYRAQVAEGIRRDGAIRRLGYLVRANYAYNYIWWFKTRSNDPARIARLGKVERLLKQPFAARRPRTERAAEFDNADFHFASGMLDPALLQKFAGDLYAAGRYNEPYRPEFEHVGRPEESDSPFLYMLPQTLFENETFLEICSSQALIDFCREALGPKAAMSWAWSWISQPSQAPYQNQNWHRDAAEPLNFVRVFIPLQAIETRADGPTELIPGTSGMREFYEIRRFSDAELEPTKAAKGAGVVLAEPGDVYFVNTFALHRGTPPAKRRALLTLLISLSPSHRTPSIRKLSLREVPERLRPAIRANKSFFRHLIR
ncbi:phytanoyl-CoA dioxygenase family protein [Sphingomonas psychrotolerans]|uniref:Phytanoyl-CoA dioxygenase n=1 Tax=Sphingomonas psychrotolerans TaxID=1327635 RepID=A0A2K8MGD6_9SPHN|nr:hypothetical protein [Sphingomonas psychrotolerans]ATY32940.1 hypothetical protein CVN68_13990 [Sphingomonas psychrotolerans]